MPKEKTNIVFKTGHYYELLSEQDEKTIAYYYHNPDADCFGFGFNIADGGGWVPESDLTCKSIQEVFMYPSKKGPEVQLQELIDVQCSDGNWNYEPYMMGMANGMLLSLSVLAKKDPKFLNVPDKWINEEYNKPYKKG